MTKAVIAFSGGLDTSFLVPFMREEYQAEEIITCTVDTGGFDAAEKQAIAARSAELGAAHHVHVDASPMFYDEIIKFLIYGRVTRDGYPLCVGAERLIQAREAMKTCQKFGADKLAHGSTGAGNDQYRFDSVIHVMNQMDCDSDTVEGIAPVRDHGVTRRFSMSYLQERGYKVKSSNADYSYNVGLWGTSIGGAETLVAHGFIPEGAWHTPKEANLAPRQIELAFEKGEMVTLRDGDTKLADPVAIIQYLNQLGGKYAIGRHYHVGTSVPGKKGRLAYESHAADIIYAAHHALEKVTLSQAQIFFKQHVATEFGRLVHEAKIFDPLLNDLKAFLQSSQQRVTGTCTINLDHGHISGVGVVSPYDLLKTGGAVYGEEAGMYSGRDAKGAALLHSFEHMMYHQYTDK